MAVVTSVSAQTLPRQLGSAATRVALTLSGSKAGVSTRRHDDLAQQAPRDPDDSRAGGQAAQTAGARAVAVAELSAALGAEVTPELLDQALTHRSYAIENDGFQDYERLELLGDSVLGFVVTAELFARHPDAPERSLARMRQAVVCTSALAEVGRTLGVGPAFGWAGEAHSGVPRSPESWRMLSRPSSPCSTWMPARTRCAGSCSRLSARSWTPPPSLARGWTGSPACRNARASSGCRRRGTRSWPRAGQRACVPGRGVAGRRGFGPRIGNQQRSQPKWVRRPKLMRRWPIAQRTEACAPMPDSRRA